ncbi:tRNA 4-thiouridine(8) synthase ThiI [Paenalkalicoccus suaedae]|uniref:Probable tRNA sulfurtransferase n=1 Tax=Paenalkalicoccus suaedae TaxID=2592382 RepID=A0A859FHB8_9BACI|nr:tRNA uracil 4-sulfurtransferase ThiI [Paenalkalicoccus suaedae]QKS72064.1 tRNA 4-thiouridine(8) synthase ThiI [Paenalkalicoccus suaedae]
MQYEHVLVRYAELSLKGKNRKKFERQLDQNIREALSEYPAVKTTRSFGRLYVLLNGTAYEDVREKLKHVFGIHSFSPAMKVDFDVDAMCEAAYTLTKEALEQRNGAGTFKINVRRINKGFPHGSAELNYTLGSYVLARMEKLTVDVKKPDVEIKVEIRSEAVFVTGQTEKGAGGLPVGTSGNVLLMLSGGIDSPVAGYLALKRGVTLEAIHFHSPPYTNAQAKKKVEDLARKLTKYAGTVKVHFVPFTELQLAIHKQIPDNCEITVTRRFMLRIAEQFAKQNGNKALVNGESLGQVASQTLDSMVAINDVTTMPVLRPLVTMDKQETIEIAREIDTYATSILPFEDCCTIFLPADPKTRPKLEKIRYYESFMNVEELVNETVAKIETVEIREREEEEFTSLL